MKKILIITMSTFFVLVLVYISGPKLPFQELNNRLPSIHLQTSEVEAFVREKESKLKIKPDNESRIIWASDSLKSKTSYCLLYLHGFAACWFEGNPVNLDFAKRYGMNLYAPLLASHGIDTTEALADMTPSRLYDSAKEALVIAHFLGQKVILMGTSTGCTLGLKLASEFPELINGLILLSPNIELAEPLAIIGPRPWGLQLGRFVFKGKYRITNQDFSSEDCHYWICKQRLEAGIYLQQLLEATMNKRTYSKVCKPLFMAYYFKDQEHQDMTVKVSAMLKMYNQLGTPENLKQKIAFPGAGCHPIGCKLFSGAWKDIELASFSFAEAKLGLLPIGQ
jgi:pimeloyl-ACP methyl ester carboxylesterase